MRRFLQLGKNSRLSIEEALNRVGAQDLLDNRMQKLSRWRDAAGCWPAPCWSNPSCWCWTNRCRVDITGQIELYALISQLAAEFHCAVLMVSHDLHLVMASTHEVICLNRHVCCHGEPGERGLATQFARLFGRPEREVLAVYTHHHPLRWRTPSS